MVVDTKLYDLLGVSPDASDSDLRKAYHEQALKLHPDRNKSPDATVKFQQVNEAYEILKDKEKREIYDRYGPEGIKRGGGGGSRFEDIFPDIFNINDIFNRREQRQRTSDIAHKINVRLEDLYNGKEVKLKINRNVICTECRGNGCAKGKSPLICPDCDGKGKRMIEQRMGFMIQRQIITCSRCKGSGHIIDEKDKCKHCNGNKIVNEKKIITVHIEPGMEDGDQIKFLGCSDEAPNAETGDLIVVLHLLKNDRFIRKNDNLLMIKKISLSEALLGCQFTFDHLDGRKIVVTSEPNQVITPHSVKIIQREGMPKRGNQFEKGDLYIKFDIEFPKSEQITNELKEALKICIPTHKVEDEVNLNDEDVFHVQTKDADIKQFENARSSYNPHENDDNTREDYETRQEECTIF
ncbi:hypothetical protein M9Y10_006706 [Tritrichomonas musculus]|uniref:Uncharacterized protein n=1 Tax=Tritrichomonas musculus TaxID=1915356 RepID=A0ABR2JEX9_9EUKA